MSNTVSYELTFYLYHCSSTEWYDKRKYEIQLTEFLQRTDSFHKNEIRLMSKRQCQHVANNSVLSSHSISLLGQSTLKGFNLNRLEKYSISRIMFNCRIWNFCSENNEISKVTEIYAWGWIRSLFKDTYWSAILPLTLIFVIQPITEDRALNTTLSRKNYFSSCFNKYLLKENRPWDSVKLISPKFLLTFRAHLKSFKNKCHLKKREQIKNILLCKAFKWYRSSLCKT